MPNPKKSVGCHVETTLEIVGGRWKVMVLYYLLDGTRRTLTNLFVLLLI